MQERSQVWRIRRGRGKNVYVEHVLWGPTLQRVSQISSSPGGLHNLPQISYYILTRGGLQAQIYQGQLTGTVSANGGSPPTTILYLFAKP